MERCCVRTAGARTHLPLGRSGYAVSASTIADRSTALSWLTRASASLSSLSSASASRSRTPARCTTVRTSGEPGCGRSRSSHTPGDSPVQLTSTTGASTPPPPPPLPLPPPPLLLAATASALMTWCERSSTAGPEKPLCVNRKPERCAGVGFLLPGTSTDACTEYRLRPVAPHGRKPGQDGEEGRVSLVASAWEKMYQDQSIKIPPPSHTAVNCGLRVAFTIDRPIPWDGIPPSQVVFLACDHQSGRPQAYRSGQQDVGVHREDTIYEDIKDIKDGIVIRYEGLMHLCCEHRHSNRKGRHNHRRR
eukprot:366537-Chlamydomonas_euryale.AAC.19